MSVRVAPSTMNSGRLQISCQMHTDKQIQATGLWVDFTKLTLGVLILTLQTTVNIAQMFTEWIYFYIVAREVRPLQKRTAIESQITGSTG